MSISGNYLDELALRFGTDKSSAHHGYTRIYAQYFEPIRMKVRRVLEIGIMTGASLRTWELYFPNAEIIGVDVVDSFRPSSESRIRTVIADAGSPELWSAQDFVCDIIIDDGSHKSSDVLAAFRGAYGLLVPGGLYVVEDVHAFGYLNKYSECLDKSALTFFLDLVHVLNEYGQNQCGAPGDVSQFPYSFIHFYKGLVIVGKR